MRIVVKIGSSSLVDDAGQRRVGLLGTLVDDIARLAEDGHDIVLVSSGAIATGLGLLGRDRRPVELPELQAASAVGQGALYATWADLFALRSRATAQVLLTMHDAAHRSSWLNARATLEQLLAWRVVPIVNENDTTATDEITFGDNDALAAQVAASIRADVLVLLTDTDGVYTAHPARPDATLVRTIDDPAMLETIDASAAGSPWGSGGMRSKLIAARMAASAGTVTCIANASTPGVVSRAAAHDPECGTRIDIPARRGSAFKVWLTHAKRPSGTIIVDAGATTAIRERGASLLPVGIVSIDGDFQAGDTVQVCATADTPPFAKGIVEHAGHELRSMIGDPAAARAARATIHRDQLVLLDSPTTLPNGH